MRKIHPLILMAIAFLITRDAYAQNTTTESSGAQSCVKMITQAIVPTPIANQPNYWSYQYTYKCVNVTNDKKKPIRIYGTVSDPSKNNHYEKCYLVETGKGEERTITSEPFYSTTQPHLGWETWTGNDCGLGTVCDRLALPVTFTSVAATKDNNSVVVQWSAAIENEPYPFVVQRSTNGFTFSDVATVQQNMTGKYSYRDQNPVSKEGKIFYRIQMQTNAGMKASPMAAVWFIAELKAYAVGKMLYLNNPNNLQVHVYALGGGQLVATSRGQTIDLSQYATGNYRAVFYNTGGETLFSDSFFMR
jgi:hypothetical protein